MSHNAWLVDVGFVVQAATDGDRFKLDYIAARSFLEKRLGKTDAYLFNSIDSSLGAPQCSRLGKRLYNGCSPAITSLPQPGGTFWVNRCRFKKRSARSF